ncbi:hypothetical protein THPR109532_08650 [Thalassospira profundimaris]
MKSIPAFRRVQDRIGAQLIVIIKRDAVAALAPGFHAKRGDRVPMHTAKPCKGRWIIIRKLFPRRNKQRLTRLVAVCDA